MNRRIFALNIVLACLAAVLVWQLRVRWISAQERVRKVTAQSATPPRIGLPPVAESPKPVSPSDYVEVAQKDLFSRDRNPDVIIEPPPQPPPPPPPPPMPALPFYHGQMALGVEPVAVLSFKGNDQKGYHAGDEVGPFKLVAFDRQMIKFEWDGKEVERNLTDLKMKEPPPEQPAPGAAAPSDVRSLTAPPAASQPPGTPKMGNEMGNGLKGCAPGDNSPAGTVVNGYRKVVSRALMGSSCYWEEIK